MSENNPIADAVYSYFFYIEVFPDCTQVGVVAPTAWSTDKEYTIYESASTFTMTAFSWANTYCSGTITYVMTATEGGTTEDITGFVTFTDSTRLFSVQTDDNTFGDRTFEVTITGTNDHGYSDTFVFTLQTHKDCQYVALDSQDFDVTSSDAALPDYTYTVTDSSQAITFSEVT